MDELISRREAIKWFFRPYSNEESYSNLDVERALKAIPAVDAAPVVHGRWVSKNEEGIYGPIYCSICDFELRIDDMPYCPWCGAKMDG